MNEGRDTGDVGGDDDAFDESAFDAAFEEAFGKPVEPGDERTSVPDDGAPVPDGGAPADVPDVAPREGLEPDGEPHVGAGGGPAITRKRSVVAVVVTPISSAPALAGLCAMAKIDADIVPTRHGALAVRVIGHTGEMDADELLTGAPAPAVELARTLSRTTKLGVVLLTSHLGEGDEGLTGTITGRRYIAGEPGDEVPAGLILSGADAVVENLLLGTLAPADAPGRLAPQSLSRWQAGRLFTRSGRRKRP